MASLRVAAALVALLASCCAVQDDSTPFTSCAEQRDPIALRVQSCTASPCRLHKGTIAVMEVDFEVDEDTNELEATCTAYALGMTVDFPLRQKNACNALTNAECPLDKYESITYRLEMDVDKQYPSISASAEITIKDKARNKSLMCFRLNFQVVDPE